jgi:hypothetical protein
MTIRELLATAREMKPTAQTDAALLQYVNEIEGRVQTEVMGIAPEDTVEYADADAVLLVGPPHDKLYIYHLIAMIDFGDGEYHKYQNELQMANGAYKEYAKWWQRTKR